MTATAPTASTTTTISQQAIEHRLEGKEWARALEPLTHEDCPA